MIGLDDAATLSLRQAPYIDAGKIACSRDTRIFLRRILPASLLTALTRFGAVFTSAVTAETTISFLGLSTSSQVASWGGMINDTRVYMLLAPRAVLFPGLALVLTLLILGLLGNGLRNYLDPRIAALLPETEDTIKVRAWREPVSRYRSNTHY